MQLYIIGNLRLIHYGASSFISTQFNMLMAILHHNWMHYSGCVLFCCHVPLLLLLGRVFRFCFTRAGRALGGLLFPELLRCAGGFFLCAGGLLRSELFCGCRARGGCEDPLAACCELPFVPRCLAPAPSLSVRLALRRSLLLSRLSLPLSIVNILVLIAPITPSLASILAIFKTIISAGSNA